MSGWAWLNLIWIVPIGLLYFFLAFAFTVVWIDGVISHRYVRKIHAQLYGSVINNCILCPVCETFVYGSKKAWGKHLKRQHNEPMYYHEPLSILFNEAKGKL